MKYIIFTFAILFSFPLFSQTINPEAWEGRQSDQAVQLYGGLKYGVILGAGYYHSFEIKNHRFWAGLEMESAAGKDLLDDHREEISLNTTLLKKGSIRLNTGIGFLHRASQNDYVNMNDLAGKWNVSVGVYRPKWFVGAEANLEHSFALRLNHQEVYREIYPDVKDGWYNSGGGNLQFGLMGGYSIGKLDLSAQLGPSINRSGRMNLLPFYGLIGASWGF